MNRSAHDYVTDDRICGTRHRLAWRFLPIAAIVALMALAYGFGVHRGLSFETLIRHRDSIDHFIAAHAVAAVAGYIALYLVAIGLSLPCGTILTVTAGYLFGPLLGGLASWIGALAGATVVFLIARGACGEFFTRRAGAAAARLAEGFQADAFNYLLFLRLVPFPFWLVNLAPALLSIRLRTFVAATAIGIIPATAAFAVFGAGLGSVMTALETQYNACVASGRSDCSVDFELSNVLTPMLLTALATLGVLALVPVVARRIWGRRMTASLPSKRP